MEGEGRLRLAHGDDGGCVGLHVFEDGAVGVAAFEFEVFALQTVNEEGTAAQGSDMYVGVGPSAAAVEVATFAEGYVLEGGGGDVGGELVVGLVHVELLVRVGMESEGQEAALYVDGDVLEQG